MRGRVLAVGLAVALSGACSSGDKPGVDVTVVRGEASVVTPSQNALTFSGKKIAGPKLEKMAINGSYVVTGANWFDGHSWHDSDPPACLAPGPRRQRVEMGVVQAKSYRDAPGRAVVVWLKCLEIPNK